MPYETIDIPLHAGLNTKADAKGMSVPGLAAASDVQFDDTGGTQTRPQFQEITDAAGNTIADIRKVAAYGDELVAFSKDKLWSYASGDGLWTDRGDYLAVKVDEHARFVTTGEQFDCDRAELDGVTMYCWSETTPSGTLSYIAAIDSETGAVKMSPTSLGAVTRPRLATTTNKICLVYLTASNFITARAYEPSDLSYASGSALYLSGNPGVYDVVSNINFASRLIGAVTEGTQYQIFIVSETGTVTSAFSRTITADGACSIALTPGTVAVSYSAGTAIYTDIVNTGYATVALDIATGTAGSATVNQIASVYDGAEFHVFWTAGATSSSNYATEHNTVSSVGTPGTEEDLVVRCGIASRAFEHDGEVYLWTAFATENDGAIVSKLQNNYFLYRSDGTIIAKAASALAGGFPATDGNLPGVVETSTGLFKWCGQLRRIVPLGQAQQGYSAKSPHEIVFEFDSNEARRTAVLGETMYIAGGQVTQYDGANLTEVGFHTFPFQISAVLTTGTNLTGVYNWLQTYSWTNAKGEFERSTTATIFTSVSYSSEAAEVKGVSLATTLKTGSPGEVTLEFWRTVAAAPVGAPFYLITSKDPSSTGDNSYIENDPTTERKTVDDNLTDAALISLETYPENGGATLASQAPPAASIVLATQDRLILAGIAGNPSRIVYSRLRQSGEVASFNDQLFVDLPPNGGEITAIAFLNETLIAFKESAVYALPGDGFDNNGGGQNYGPGRILPTDVGAVSHESVALTPKGLIFKSTKGWHLLNHSWQAQYIGGAVAEYDTDTVVSVHVMESQHQVRIVTDARTIVWDYLLLGMQSDPLVAGQWATWTVYGTDSVVWAGVHHIVNSDDDGLLAQSSSHSGSGDLPQLDLTTGWIKVDGLQGYGLVRRLLLLGEYLGAHDLRIRVAYNYDDSWIDDKTWTVSPASAGTLQLEHGLSRPKCESVKFRITAQAVGAATAPVTSALNLTGMSIELKQKKNHFGKGMGTAQKQ